MRWILSLCVLAILMALWALVAPSTSEVALTLSLVVGAIAAGAVAVATFRERIVIKRLVARLRDPETRERTVRELRLRVDRALASRNDFRREEALRFVLEPLIIAGLWDEVASFAERAELTHRIPGQDSFWRWLAGVRALAELHRGETSAADTALAAITIDEPWLYAIDALRLAVAGRGDEAMARIEQIGSGRVGLATAHQRDLATVHALAAQGKRDQARKVLKRAAGAQDGFLQAVLNLEGPATSIARAMLAGRGGPFRAGA